MNSMLQGESLNLAARAGVTMEALAAVAMISTALLGTQLRAWSEYSLGKHCRLSGDLAKRAVTTSSDSNFVANSILSFHEREDG